MTATSAALTMIAALTLPTAAPMTAKRAGSSVIRAITPPSTTAPTPNAATSPIRPACWRAPCSAACSATRSVADATRTGATVAGVVAGGAVGAALTNKMNCEDRSYAYDTYARGFNGGRAGATYEWRNPNNGNRGEMRVIDYYNDEDNFRCSVFTNTIYIDNRPQEARGRACQQPNGTWAIID